jgi:hypothetical protein
MIRRPLFQLLSQKYEVFEGENDPAPVGKASVTDGLIDSLMVKDDAPELFRGQIFNRLLRSIIEDANRHNSNLSIKVADPNAIRLKRFLERYGFRESKTGIFKRTAGSFIPPSVLY